jgi:WD40 repeat protein
MIASGSDDQTVRLWDTSTGAQIGDALVGHSRFVTCLVFSPDGRMIASGDGDGTVRLWDESTGAQIGDALTGHSRSVNCLGFSPDGRMITSGSFDQTVWLWDTSTGAQIGDALPVMGHSNFVNYLAFSPNGGMITFSSDDDTIRLWDVATGGAMSLDSAIFTSQVTASETPGADIGLSHPQFPILFLDEGGWIWHKLLHRRLFWLPVRLRTKFFVTHGNLLAIRLPNVPILDFSPCLA